MKIKPVATNDFDCIKLSDVSLLDLFLYINLDIVELDEEQIEKDEEEEEETVELVENLVGDSQWFFLTRGKVPGGPIIGGTSRRCSPWAIIASKNRLKDFS